MKKLLLISILMGALPFTMAAQDDDLYFSFKKKTTEKKVAYNDGGQTAVYHSGSNRNVDEYNRMESKYVVIGNDSVNDIIEFSAEKGVYPDSLSMAASDSLAVEDYALTKKMMRFDDYDLTENAAFWAGYHLGRDTWNWGTAWHSPWYYHTYGWYGGWYDPWYYSYSIYDPWYSRYIGLYDPWYNWYYGIYDPWYIGWHDPWRYNWGYYPYGYYYYDYAYYPYYRSYGGGGRYHNTYNGNTGTINRNGNTHGYFAGDRSVGRSSSSSSSVSSSRSSSLRDRTVGNHSSRVGSNSSTSTRTSNSGNFSGSRSTSTYNNSVSTSRSSSTYSSGSSGGSFSSSSSGGGSFSGGGGGGGRSGGGSLGGRR